MGQTTIEWTGTRLPDGTMQPGFTFNPVWGCFKVSPGCTHCYAETLSTRYGQNIWGPPATTQRRTFGEKYWNNPRRWNAQATKLGYPLKVFCASMADVFEDHTTTGQERKKLWPLIEETPMLTWLLLTKRPEHIVGMVPHEWKHGFPENVWIGTSVESQLYAEHRIPDLLEVPARVHFLSCEPLLGEVTLHKWLPELQWVIVGGESGPKHRVMQPEWARALRDECVAAQVPYFFKQVGGMTAKSGGKELDGQVWDEMPDMQEREERT